MELADARPVGEAAGEIIVAQVEGRDAPEGARRPVAVDVARVDAADAKPAVLESARVGATVRVPAIIVEPVRAAEEREQVY